MDDDKSNAEAGKPIEIPPIPLPYEPSLLPFSRWQPLLWGLGIGLAYRLAFTGGAIFGWHVPDVMSMAFLFGTPVAVGAITVFMAERIERRQWSYYVLAPMLSMLLVCAGTAIIMIEGSICIAMALPIFLPLGSVGGIVAGIAIRLLTRASPGLSAFALLPFALSGIESGIPVRDQLGQVDASIDIAAPPEAVWQQLNAASDIQPLEVTNAWIYRIGVPRPVEGRTLEAGVGGVRLSRWEKDVQFRERITDWQPAQYVRWTYEFDANSFPRGALDDHVMIGGRHFDLLDTSYRLEPHAGGTRLTIHTDYRVTTAFNWYSDAIAQWVLRDFSHTILGMYRQRAERETL